MKLNSRGFISIIALVFIAVLSINSLATMDKLTLAYKKPQKRLESLEAYYRCESRIYESLLDPGNFDYKLGSRLKKDYRSYNPMIWGCLSSSCKKKTCSGRSCYNDKGESIYYFALDDKRYIRVFSIIKDSDIVNVQRADVGLLSPVFMNDEILNIGKSSDLEELFDEISDYEFNKDAEWMVTDQEIAYISNEGGDNVFLTGDEKYLDKEVFICLKNKDDKAILKIDSNYEESLELRGLLVVEGDLIIDTDLEFSGIMIVKGNVRIKEASSLRLDGKLIATALEGDLIEGRKRLNGVLRYGSYLPGFFRVEIISIKGG